MQCNVYNIFFKISFTQTVKLILTLYTGEMKFI